MKICPNCGKENEETNNFCKKCGFNIGSDNSAFEEYAPAYGKFTRKIENKLKNSKLLDQFFENIIPGDSKLHEKDHMDNWINRKHLEMVEPAFLEVYDSIDDFYIKSLLMIEKHKVAGGGTFGTTAIFPSETPTGKLSYKESVRFYEDLLKKVKQDLEKEKQNPNFNEREYYKKKRKEYTIENISNLGVPRRDR